MRYTQIRTSEAGVIKLSYLFEFLICVFYTWYFLPVFQTLFWTNTYKILFFSCFLIGTIGLFFLNGYQKNRILIPIVAYMLIFVFLYVLKVGDAQAHIRVSFMFWGTALLYFGILNDENRVRIGKYLLLLFLLTVVTSALGVIADNNAARTIAHAAAEDELQAEYKLKNISNIYLFQCLILFIPMLICVPQKARNKVGGWILIALIVVTLLNASFTISLIIGFFALLLSLALKETRSKRLVVMIIMSIIVFLILLNGATVLTYLANRIDNAKISVRLCDLRDLIYFGESSGDIGLRMELYRSSIQTFFKQPFGCGVHYSYRTFENGIGYHSQILDDLARYGIVAAIFYVMLFRNYYTHLKTSWKHIGYPQIAITSVVIYSLLLVLNLGFRSADESIVLFFILPVMPLLIEDFLKKKHQSRF